MTFYKLKSHPEWQPSWFYHWVLSNGWQSKWSYKTIQSDHIKQLSKYTAITIHHTCKRIVNLCQYFLAISCKHMLFGQFKTDPLEKEFSKLCQGSGGTYEDH